MEFFRRFHAAVYVLFTILFLSAMGAFGISEAYASSAADQLPVECVGTGDVYVDGIKPSNLDLSGSWANGGWVERSGVYANGGGTTFSWGMRYSNAAWSASGRNYDVMVLGTTYFPPGLSHGDSPYESDGTLRGITPDDWEYLGDTGTQNDITVKLYYHGTNTEATDVDFLVQFTDLDQQADGTYWREGVELVGNYWNVVKGGAVDPDWAYSFRDEEWRSHGAIGYTDHLPSEELYTDYINGHPHYYSGHACDCFSDVCLAMMAKSGFHYIWRIPITGGGTIMGLSLESTPGSVDNPSITKSPSTQTTYYGQKATFDVVAFIPHTASGLFFKDLKIIDTLDSCWDVNAASVTLLKCRWGDSPPPASSYSTASNWNVTKNAGNNTITASPTRYNDDSYTGGWFKLHIEVPMKSGLNLDSLPSDGANTNVKITNNNAKVTWKKFDNSTGDSGNKKVSVRTPVWRVKVLKDYTDAEKAALSQLARPTGQYDLRGAQFKLDLTNPQSGWGNVSYNVRGSFAEEQYTVNVYYPGTYSLTETNLSNKGFKLTQHPNQRFTLADGSGSASGYVANVDYDNDGIYTLPGNDLFQKIDAEWLTSDPQGNATLAGAQYRVEFWGGTSISGAPLASAVFATNAEGKLVFGAGPTVLGTNWPYKVNGQNILPIGTFRITEVNPPQGYLVNTGFSAVGSVTQDSNNTTATINKISGWSTRKGGSGPQDRCGDDAVRRGNIDVYAVDDTLRTYHSNSTSQTETGEAVNQPDDAQGNGTRAGTVYSIVNRSTHPVMSPEQGHPTVPPGGVVCTIKTDSTGKASTSAGAALNGWDIPASWRGKALPYGDYEVFEIEAPVGYMLGHWDGDASTYYSMCTSGATTPLLTGNLNATQQAAFRFSNSDPLRNTYTAGSTIQRTPPNSTKTWIDDEGALVTFTSRGAEVGNRLDNDNLPVNWPEDTPQRGNIEVVKADDTLKTHDASETPSAADPDAQGNSTLEGAVYSVVNRSTHAVVSPETGGIVQPGQVICHIKTDASGFATTANSRYGWNVPSGWHGALPYGDYEVFEIEAPVGYMLGHWDNRDVTYYSMCTEHASAPLLNAQRSTAYDFAGTKDNIADYENKYYVSQATVKRNSPDAASHQWLDTDSVTVSFKTRSNGTDQDLPNQWSEDTVKRADLEFLKADDALDDHEGTLAVVDYAGRCKPEGNATLKDARFAIVNRSDRAVVNPFGELVQPNDIVCYVYTDENGYASTKLTPERIAVNRWDQRSSTGVDGVSYPAGTLYATDNGWHGALAYGEYEIFEVDPPQGYLNGHWFEHLDTKILTRNAGMAIKGSNVGVKTHIIGEYDDICTYGDNLDGVERNYQEIYPNSAHTWIDVSNAEVGKHPASNANSDLVTFTRDAAQNGSSAPDPAGQQRGDPKEQRFEDTVIRGDLELVKADDTLDQSDQELGVTDYKGRTKPQGDASLQYAEFTIINRSDTVVVSPQTGKEVWPKGATIPNSGGHVSDGIVCVIVTDENGFASTALTADRISINRWDRENVPTYAPFSAGECFATVNGWHGALAYGEYEVYESKTPEGYMLDHQYYNCDAGVYNPLGDHDYEVHWAGMAVRQDVPNPKGTASDGNDKYEIYPSDGSVTWIGADRELITFTTDDHWFEDTVMRGNIELQKVDADLNVSDHDNVLNIVDRNGRAHLEGAVFGVYNRSNTVVVSPQTGKEVWPAGATIPGSGEVSDGLVCTIITDKDGFASTALDAARVTINEWDQELVDGYSLRDQHIHTPDHQYYTEFAAGECFATVNGWHGALAYGQYEIVEITPPTGYMMNKTWHGMATEAGSGMIPTVDSESTPLLAGKGVRKDEAVAVAPNSNDGSKGVRFDRARISFGSAEPSSSSAKPTFLPWSQDAGSPTGYADKAYTEKNRDTWIKDEVIRGGVRIGDIDRQNQQYKPQGKGSLETHIIGIFSTNPSPVTIYEPSDGLASYNGFGVAGSKYQTTTLGDGTKSWTYPSWDQVAGNANGVYDYNPLVDPTFEYGKQTSDGVFVGYITTRAVEEDGRIEYVAETDPYTLPYGTYVLREIEVPYNTGYLFDEVSMNWREDFGIGDDFDYVERYGEAGESPIWYSHSKDYRFQANYKENQSPNGSYSDGTQHPLYYRGDERNYYIGAYHHTYADDPEHDTGQSKVGFRGEYYNRVVPTQAHKEELDNQYVDFTDESRFCVSNYISRGDLAFDKMDDNNVELGYVPFLITSLTTGESHIVVTDINGHVDTRQSAATRVSAPYRAHSYMTNKNDYALRYDGLVPVLAPTGIGRTADISTIAQFENGYWVDPAKGASPKTPDLNWTYGIWFYGRIDAPTIHAQMDGPHGLPDYRPEYNHNWYTGTEEVYIDNPVTNAGSAAGYKEPLGALPYDDYIIQELPVEQRTVTEPDGAQVIVPDTAAYKMIGETRFTIGGSWNNSAEFIDGQGHVHTSYNDIQNGNVALVERDLRNVRSSDIQTTLSTGKNYENHYGSAVADAVLYDTIRYYNLDEGSKYTVVGELHRLYYDASDVPYAGELIAESRPQTFIPNGSDGSVVVPFEFDASSLQGGAVVAFEYLYKGPSADDTQLVGAHEDAADAKQTVSYPVLGTDLADAADGDKEIFATAEVQLTDTLHYEGLLPGKVYTIKGALMVVGDDGKAVPAKNADGTPVTSSEKYGPIPAGQFVGDIDVTFTFTNPALAGKKLVAYERVYTTPLQNEAEELIASHEDPSDPRQAVYSPSIDTIATDAGTGAHIGYADEDGVVIDDVVNYHNLIAGNAYEIRGTVMDASDGSAILTADGRRQEASVQFVAGDRSSHECGEADGNGHVSGSVRVSFVLEGKDLLGKTAVIFERCVLLGAADERTPTDVARHEDPSDESQRVTYPMLDTTAFDDATKAHDGCATETVVIGDDVAFDALFKGDEYTVSGWLMDRETGEAILDDAGNPFTSSTRFVAGEGGDADDGTRVPGAVRMAFEVPGRLVEGKDVVVFEELYYDGHLIARHADIADGDQEVSYPRITTTAEMARGGKEAPSLPGSSIADTIEYFNLIPGQSYRASGILMFKDTAEPALNPMGEPILATLDFVPESESGTCVTRFDFDASTWGYKDIVVFETIERFVPGDGGGSFVTVAKHEDISDVDQTVSFVQEGDLKSEPIIPVVVEMVVPTPPAPAIIATGDGLLLIVAALALSAACTAGIVAYRKKRKR